jgi:predicted nucleic acid-binding protein
MVRPDSGPRRSESVDAYLRGTRVLAAVALLALVGGVLSDALDGRAWAGHPLLAGLVASVIVVMLTVALVNEALERRSRQRWSVLAQYVTLQLVRDARLVWTGVAELAGLMPSDPFASDVLTAATAIDAGSSAVRDTDRLTAALRELVAHADKRKRLHDKVTMFLEHNDAVLGRWAAVMLNADLYAEVIDRHVELAGDLAWLSSLLAFELAESDGQTREARSHPAALIEGPLDDGTLVQRLAAITQLAEQLDRGTLAVALRVVPIEWWREQLGATVPASLDTET